MRTNTLQASSRNTTTAPAAAVPSTDDAGKLLLRVAVGVLVLLHGVFKLHAGVGFIGAMLERAGLPSALGYLVFVGEVLAPLMLIVGIGARAGAAIIAVNMLVAIGLVHAPDLFSLTKQGGWALELQGLYLFGALSVVLLGAGRYSVGGVQGRFN